MWLSDMPPVVFLNAVSPFDICPMFQESYQRPCCVGPWLVGDSHLERGSPGGMGKLQVGQVPIQGMEVNGAPG